MIILKKRKRKLGICFVRGVGVGISTLRPLYAPKTPPCIAACPSSNDIRGYLTTIAQSEGYGRTYDESLKMAWYILTETNPFPATTGRVCPHPCEQECNRQGKDEAISINSLERFIGDWGINNNLSHKKLYNDTFPEKIGIIGGGPSGLSCAYHLARMGYRVSIFEEKEKLGGMLRYGIPRYRLPSDILDAEIQKILDLGIDVVNKKVGIDELNDFNAIYVAIGAQVGSPLNIKGEERVLSAVSFLNKINSGEKIDIGDSVVVIGGGNSAIDCARSSKRLGKDVTILYRRTKNEMPAIKEEVEEALKEGVKIEFLVAPLEITDNWLKCIRMELSGEKDEKGRQKPIAIPGSEFNIKQDTIIAAISQIPDFSGLEDLNDNGWISVNERQRTKIENVFAGGDVTNKLGFATDAIGLGRKAALAIDEYIREKEPAKSSSLPIIKYTNMNLNYYESMQRKDASSQEDAIYEAKRCMSCGMCFDCDNCFTYCSDSAVKRLPKGQHYEFHLETCQGCKKCAEECPCGYIDMM
jgi:NADPH-dependent glutamate synthase beta subunit-like oxidoreductase